MKTKIEYALQNFNQIIHNLYCPICSENVYIKDKSIECTNKHNFSLNKKGYFNAASPLNDQIYTNELFKARRIILTSNIYSEIYSCINEYVTNDNNFIVDVGSGEGTYLAKVYDNNPNNNYLGIDLAKPAINIATDYTNCNFIIADLANIPIKDNCVDYVLNVLSPANYHEFNRILKTDGLLIKVIPNAQYLFEIRNQINKDSHDNSAVLAIVKEKMNIIEIKDIKYTKAIDLKLSNNLFKMTPMTSNSENDNVITEITIDLKIIICRKQV